MANRILARLALLVFGVLLALALLEVGLQVWYRTNGTERERMLYLYDRDQIAEHTAQLIGVPYLNYTLNPDWEDINTRGIRGELVTVPKPAGVFRIVALGGSTTFGHDLSTDEAWPAQLQRILRDEYGYEKVEVVNLGVPGYHSLDSLVSLGTRGLALEPDLVISYDGLNDAIVRMYQHPDCYAGDTPLFSFGMDRGIWRPGGDDLPASTLHRVLALHLGWMEDPTTVDSRLEPTGWCPPEPDSVSQLDLLAQNPPTHFERNLRSITALTQSREGRMLLSSVAWDTAAAEWALANDPALDGTRAMQEGIAEQNALAEQIADDTGALFVDLAAEMNPDGLFQGDMVHQTAEGARRQAAIYAAFLAAADALPE